MESIAERDGRGGVNRETTSSRVAATVVGIAGAAYLASVLASWARYGSTLSKGPNDSMLDRFMPNYEVALTHSTVVNAPAGLTFASIRTSDLERSPIVRALFGTREFFMRAKHEEEDAHREGLTINELVAIGWGVLAVEPGREIVLGTITKPWERNSRFRSVNPGEFAGFDEPGYAKITLAICVDEVSSERSEARTETRVQTTDPISRSKFRPYWALLSPGMVIIRRVMLRQVKNEAESVWERSRSQWPLRTELKRERQRRYCL
jgi:hypothetical protein